MRAIIGGLRRVLASKGLWLLAWVSLMVVGLASGWIVRSIAAIAMKTFDVLDTERIIFSLLNALGEHPALGVSIGIGSIVGAGISALMWTLISPVAIVDLAAPQPGTEIGHRALARLPAVVVQSIWHLLMRGGLMVGVGLIAHRMLPITAAISVDIGLWLVSGVALDVTRVMVVEHQAAPFHIRTAVRGWWITLRRPWLLLPCIGLSAAQLLLAATILWLGLAGLGTAGPWLPRVLSVFGVGLGLWRLGTVIDALHHRPS